MIQLGGEAAVVVPLGEHRTVSALQDRAAVEDVEDAAIAEYEAWKAAGRPGGTVPHDAVVTELLGGPAGNGEGRMASRRVGRDCA